MKKIFLLLGLVISSFGFSSTILERLSSNAWNCTSLRRPFSGVIYVHFLTKEEKPHIMFTHVDTYNATKTKKLTTYISNLDFEINENDKSIYFTNLNEETKLFSDFKLSYSIDRKNRMKLFLNRISDNYNICSLS